MIGYLNAAAALTAGYTHHGKYFGIPLWLGDVHGETLKVRTKWAPMEPLLHLALHIESFMAPILYPHDERGFMFQLGKPIGVSP